MKGTTEKRIELQVEGLHYRGKYASGEEAGVNVFAATFNEQGYLEVKVTGVGPETTFGKIIKLVEEAEAVKAPVQKFAD